MSIFYLYKLFKKTKKNEKGMQKLQIIYMNASDSKYIKKKRTTYSFTRPNYNAAIALQMQFTSFFSIIYWKILLHL